MKHILLIILSVFLSLTTLSAQDFWEVLPFPSDEDIRGLAVGDSGFIIAGVKNDVLDVGGVMRSVDSGQIWEKVLSIDRFSILSVAIGANGKIYAGSNYMGYLFISDDYGNSWDSIQIPTLQNIVTIKAIGSDTVFLGLWGTLQRSYDGGETWTEVFAIPGVQYISDIITKNGKLYISLMGFFEGTGGVYCSSDWGETWDTLGLKNYMVSSLAFNSKGDLFAGSWGGNGSGDWGIYVLRSGSHEWQLLFYASVGDLLINSEDAIYCGVQHPSGFYYSVDDGSNFYLLNSGVYGNGVPTTDMQLDDGEHIYMINFYSAPYIYHSVNTTVDSKEPERIYNDDLQLFSNPCTDLINFKIRNQLSGDALVTIVDMTGRKLIENKVVLLASENTMDISALPQGIYSLNVLADKANYSALFVKQ